MTEKEQIRLLTDIVHQLVDGNESTARARIIDLQLAQAEDDLDDEPTLPGINPRTALERASVMTEHLLFREASIDWESNDGG